MKTDIDEKKALELPPRTLVIVSFSALWLKYEKSNT